MPARPHSLVYLTRSHVYIILISALCPLRGLGAPDSKGMNFFIAPPYCSSFANPNILIIPQTIQQTNVTITTNTGNVIIYIIGANDYLRLPLNCTQTTWGSVVKDGIQLTANKEVTVFMEYDFDVLLVLPVDVFSTAYKVITIQLNDYTGSAFIISGSVSLTHVHLTIPDNASDISLSFGSHTYVKGEDFYIVLNELESVRFYCDCDISGVLIEADNPILVSVANFNQSKETFTAEQLLPLNVWGRYFLFPLSSWIRSDLVLHLTGKGGSTSGYIESQFINECFSLVNDEKYVLQLNASEYIAISSNATILPMVLFHTMDINQTYHPELMTIVPMEQFAYRYHFSAIDSGTNNSFGIAIENGSSNSVVVSSNDFHSTLQGHAVHLRSENITLYTDILVSHAITIEPVIEKFRPTFCVLLIRSENTSKSFILGMRMASLYDACVETTSVIADGLDNDCDGRVDEEVGNQLDDDSDMRIDEDVLYAKDETAILEQPTTTPDLSGNSTFFTPSAIAIITSLITGICAAIIVIGTFLLVERLRHLNIIRSIKVGPMES